MNDELKLYILNIYYRKWLAENEGEIIAELKKRIAECENLPIEDADEEAIKEMLINSKIKKN